VQSGLSLQDFGSLVAGSSEFTTDHGAQTDADYIDSLYQNGLARPADVQGAAWWTGLLNAGTMSRADVMFGIATSRRASSR
jgi:hypothetical protein